MSILTKIISGGQTGADRAGLDAAKMLGLATGGHAPMGWRTENGSDPGLAEFGLVETEVENYATRTLLNIRSSDATVIFGTVTSPGSRLTLRLARRERKPVIVNPSILQFCNWLEDYDVGVLNVAGNRESKYPGIGAKVKTFLIDALG